MKARFIYNLWRLRSYEILVPVWQPQGFSLAGALGSEYGGKSWRERKMNIKVGIEEPMRVVGRGRMDIGRTGGIDGIGD